MSEKRVTKREMFEMIKGIVVDAGVENEDELVAFIEKEQNALVRKTGTKTKIQKENEVLVEVVYNALAAQGKAVTATELLADATIAEAGIATNQKLSALLKKLVDAQRVAKTSDKKKSYFEIMAD
jgi:hypothetical protein